MDNKFKRNGVKGRIFLEVCVPFESVNFGQILHHYYSHLTLINADKVLGSMDNVHRHSDAFHLDSLLVWGFVGWGKFLYAGFGRQLGEPYLLKFRFLHRGTMALERVKETELVG